MKQEVLWKPHEGPQTEFSKRLEDVVLYGGTKGPGKSDALLMEGLRQIDHPRYHAIIIRRNMPRVQALIDRSQNLFPAFGAKWHGKENRWMFPSGAIYSFGHCEFEQHKYNYQGKEFTYIGIDQCEEFSESQVDFIMAQNRTSAEGLKCYVRLTANPGGPGQAWVRRKFIYLLDVNGKKIGMKKPFETYSQEFKLQNNQTMTRTSCYIPGTIYDNPTLLKNNPTYLATLSSLPEAERKAFLEGDWEAFLSQCIFDRAGMRDQQEMIEEPRWVGLLKDTGHHPEFFRDENERLKIWRHPNDRRRYFIFADVSKGPNSKGETPDERDYSCALVFDRNTQDVVAEWHGQIGSLEFGSVLYGLGLYYRTAKIAVEAWPGPGGATIQKLVELGYPNLFKHLKWDGEKHVDTADYGWITDQRSRYDMIETLKEAIRKKETIIRSQTVLDEMENFIRLRNGKDGAREGCYDDRVICAAGALHCMKFDPVAEMAGEKPYRGNDPIVVQSAVIPQDRNGRRHGQKWKNRYAGVGV